MDRGDADSGWRRIERFEAIMDPAQPYEAASLVNMKSWHGLHTGDAALTCRHAGEAVRLFEAAGSIPHTVNAYNGYLWGCAETGDEAAARRAIGVLRGLTAVPNMAWGRWCADAAEALFALRTGDETTLAERLARLFERDWQRRDQYGHQLGWARKWAAALVVAAVERGIAVGNARRFARNFALDAPGPPVLDWPWPVRITTLGRFSVEVNGEPVAFPGRAPHETLALLKALVALGSQDVRDYLLIDALWPDADGDQARDAFRVTLHRLRKLLGQSDAVVVADGCLSLDARICWVDTLAFDTALQAQDHAGLVTTLYRGEFLPADRDEPWTLFTRERLKQRFARYVGDRGDRLERAGLIDEATALYSSAIDADAQQELFYLGLVRCHRAAGRDAQARAVLEQLHRTQTAAGQRLSAKARETT
jgi:DNA-binding SARP family transcriptional activator